jgi:L-threonylcarbamoyladenylate synthase
MVQESAKVETMQNSSVRIIRASGMLEKHYSPKCKIILDETPIAGQGFLALSNMKTPKGVVRIASPKNLKEFAQVLYKSFRKADELNLKSLIVHQPEGEGLAVAIRDRLSKAANGR